MRMMRLMMTGLACDEDTMGVLHAESAKHVRMHLDDDDDDGDAE